MQDIYIFTEQTWGKRQAKRYLTGLFGLFDLLGREPSLGRPRSELGEGIRSIPHGAHMVLYMAWHGETAIVRVLHGRMDIEAAFDGYDPMLGIAAKRPS